MGIQEIKEEVISRKFTAFSGDIRAKDEISSEFFLSLSIKNFFLTELWEYAGNLNMEEIYTETKKLLLESKIPDMNSLGIHFEDVMNKLIAWIKNRYSPKQQG